MQYNSTHEAAAKKTILQGGFDTIETRHYLSPISQALAAVRLSPPASAWELSHGLVVAVFGLCLMVFR